MGREYRKKWREMKREGDGGREGGREGGSEIVGKRGREERDGGEA